MSENFSGDVLLVGYGSLARRRLLPALATVTAVRTVHRASKSLPTDAELPQDCKSGAVFRDYPSGLAQLKPRSLVYISLPNSLHCTWALAALEAGHHVIIDKPALLDSAQAREVSALATQRGLCCAEANAWLYHPLAAALKGASSRLSITSAQAVFVNPPLPSDNFRYQRALGGGVILDRASYAVTCGKLIFGGAACAYETRVLSATDEGVECRVQQTLVYPGGRILTCLFGWDGEYANQVELFGATGKISAQRIFTPPPDFTGQLRVVEGGIERTEEVPAADSFGCMLTALCVDLERGSHQSWLQDLCEGAYGVEALQRAKVPTVGTRG